MTERLLITHIGNPATKNNEYPRTAYQLGERQFETSMIGFGLIDLLTPDRVILLGTTGSQWSALPFMAGLEDMDDALTDTLAHLEEVQNADGHTDTYDALLNTLGHSLGAHLGRPIECRLVPYMDGDQVNRQTARYLHTVQSLVPEGARVILDVTHGLRYLPMLALLSAAYMRVTRRVHIEQILYGALERKHSNGGVAPILTLDSLLQVIDWISALNSYDKDGDYGVFAPLMQTDGVPDALTQALARAAYYERITNATKAKESLQPVHQHTFDEANPLTQLFEPQLKDRLAWTKASNRGDIEFRLAEQYLRRKDFLRASIYAQEGYISKQVLLQGGDLNNFQDRSAASNSVTLPAYKNLRKLRNALAHGLRNNDTAIRTILASEETLESTLKAYIQQLKRHD